MKLNNNVYDVLKWLCILCLPALSTLVIALGEIWSLPYAQPVASTITAVAVFLGAILGISSANYSDESEGK